MLLGTYEVNRFGVDLSQCVGTYEINRFYRNRCHCVGACVIDRYGSLTESTCYFSSQLFDMQPTIPHDPWSLEAQSDIELPD